MYDDGDRGVDATRFPVSRKIVGAAMWAGRHASPVHGLIEVDVTEARRRMREDVGDHSFTAYVVASVGRAAAAHPAVHAYRDWRGRLITHRHVDVSTIVEVATADGPFPFTYTLRDAHRRTVTELTAELRDVSRRPPIESGWRRRLGSAARIPGVMRAVFWIMRRSVWMRRRVGTTVVTAVGMFGGGAGFGITQPSVMTLSVLVGGITHRPRVVDGTFVVREILDLTISVDHNIVDGAPAARFAADLRRLLESGAALPVAPA